MKLEDPNPANGSQPPPAGIPRWGELPSDSDLLKPDVKKPGELSQLSQRESATTFQSISDMGHQSWINSLMENQPSANDLREPQHSSAAITNVVYSTIWDELMNACVKPAIDSTGSQEFIPLGALLRILSPRVVNALLCQIFPKDSAGIFENEVYGFQGEPKRLKIMATLILIQKPEFLRNFIEAKIEDRQLPLVVKREGLQPVLYDRNKKKIEPSREWPWCYGDADYFAFKQMYLCSLFCTIDENGTLMDHFRLPANFVLPFLSPRPPVVYSGGFGKVTKVFIEPSHLRYRGNYTKPQYFAIKAVQHISTDQNHPTEAESLARRLVIKQVSDREHLHQLLFSFRRSDFYYLVFEWADGDLTNLWKTMSDCYKPNKYEDVCWFFRQCAGIACSLNSLHNHTSSYTARTPEERLVHVIFPGSHGRHGDIKPENILWFEDYQGNKKDHLVIADLGLTQFNTTQSKSHALWAGVKGYTQTYKAPESDTRDEIGNKYDIWSLGCVFLEHASVFLMANHSCIKDFSNARLKEDQDRNKYRNYHSDTFYNVSNRKKFAFASSNVISKIPHGAVKKAVKQRIQHLQSHKSCSDSMSEFLDLIGENMLVPDPSFRYDAETILSRLRGIESRCMDSYSYACASNYASTKKHLRTEPYSRRHDVQTPKPQILTGISGGQKDPNARLEISDIETEIDANAESQPAVRLENEVQQIIDAFNDGSNGDAAPSLRDSVMSWITRRYKNRKAGGKKKLL